MLLRSHDISRLIARNVHERSLAPVRPIFREALDQVRVSFSTDLHFPEEIEGVGDESEGREVGWMGRTRRARGSGRRPLLPHRCSFSLAPRHRHNQPWLRSIWCPSSYCPPLISLGTMPCRATDVVYSYINVSRLTSTTVCLSKSVIPGHHSWLLNQKSTWIIGISKLAGSGWSPG